LSDTTEILALGRMLPEGAPLYHYCLGGIGARIVLPHREVKPFTCSTCYIGELNVDPVVLSPFKVDTGRLLRLVDSWKPDFIFLDGIEPLESAPSELLDGKPVAARTQGFTGIPDTVEALVYDVFPGKYRGASPLRVRESLEEASSSGVHLEIVFYVETLRRAPLAPFLEPLRGDTIIHVEYQGQASIVKSEKLADSLKENGFSFVYVRDSERWIIDDTECPVCGRKIVSRVNGIAVGYKVTPGSECGYCGSPLPFRRVCSRRNPGRDSMVKKGVSTEWVNPAGLGLTSHS